MHESRWYPFVLSNKICSSNGVNPMALADDMFVFHAQQEIRAKKISLCACSSKRSQRLIVFNQLSQNSLYRIEIASNSK